MNLIENTAEKGPGEGANRLLLGTTGVGAGGGTGKGRNSPMIVALALLVMSVGAIYAMRRVGTVSGMGGDQLKVDYQPSVINAEFERRFVKAMDDLARSGRPLQVSAEELGPAPFDLRMRLSMGTVVAEGDDSSRAQMMAARAAAERDAESRRQQAEALRRVSDAASGLTVQGIIGGRVPVATISGRMCRVGDQVADGVLTVASIERDGVVVEGGGRRFLLQLGKRAVALEE